MNHEEISADCAFLDELHAFEIVVSGLVRTPLALLHPYRDGSLFSEVHEQWEKAYTALNIRALCRCTECIAAAHAETEVCDALAVEVISAVDELVYSVKRSFKLWAAALYVVVDNSSACTGHIRSDNCNTTLVQRI